MTTTWILVANAAAAAIFTNDGPQKGLVKMKTMQHAASREKSSELVTDRPGHTQSRGNGRGAYVPAKTPKEIEAERFALELARTLDHGRTAHAFQRVILIAPPHFMGLINQHLDPHVRQLVGASIEKDYTKLDEKELVGHLESHIYL